MLLKELKEYNYIPNDGFYSTEEWYISIVPRIKDILTFKYGTREIIEDSFFYNIEVGINENIVDYVKNNIDILFIEKNESYKKVWEVLNAKYNPIWNVESKETLSYNKSVEGSEGVSERNTGTVGVVGNDTGTVGVTGSDTGTITNESENEGSGVNSLTPYDSSTFLQSDKTESEVSNSATTTNNLAHSETTTNNLAHSNTRTDNLTHTSDKDNEVNESYEEVKERGGNIGVTKSSELVESEIALRLANNFTNIVAKDIVNYICYSC